MKKTTCSQCKSPYVVNKRYLLCEYCNFKRLHNGKDRFQVEREKNGETPTKGVKAERKKNGGKEGYLKVCLNCKKERYIVNKKYCLCIDCNKDRLTEQQSEKPQSLKEPVKKKKNTDIEEDGKFFREIWNERRHYSEVSGQFLGDEFSSHYCSHILTKGAFPKFRRVKENIKLVTPEEHHQWEFGDRDKLRQDIRWNWVFERYDKLKKKYHEK